MRIPDSVLRRPGTYNTFASWIGAHDIRRFLVSRYIRVEAGDRVLDMGCGTARILSNLPAVAYVGFDVNPAYIEVARRQFHGRGTFLCGESDHPALAQEAPFDVALALGVLHHLDDHAAGALLRLARSVLRPGGRLVTIDGCFEAGQPWIARLMLRWDRGRHVRTRDEYLRLAMREFPNTAAHRHDHLLRLPYTHLIMECLAS